MQLYVCKVQQELLEHCCSNHLPVFSFIYLLFSYSVCMCFCCFFVLKCFVQFKILFILLLIVSLQDSFALFLAKVKWFFCCFDFTRFSFVWWFSSLFTILGFLHSWNNFEKVKPKCQIRVRRFFVYFCANLTTTTTNMRKERKKEEQKII